VGQFSTGVDRAAVANFGWIRLKGFSAWLARGAVHLTLLMGMRNRAVVYMNWIWSWLTWSRGARLITESGHPAGYARRPEG
jgi:NADH dehydrogenase